LSPTHLLQWSQPFSLLPFVSFCGLFSGWYLKSMYWIISSVASHPTQSKILVVQVIFRVEVHLWAYHWWVFPSLSLLQPHDPLAVSWGLAFTDPLPGMLVFIPSFIFLFKWFCIRETFHNPW
jgi:hypothetical protein